MKLSLNGKKIILLALTVVFAYILIYVNILLYIPSYWVEYVIPAYILFTGITIDFEFMSKEIKFKKWKSICRK